VSEQVGTDLYQRTIAFDYGDIDRGDLMREVWTPTPWMVDAYVGSDPYKRERDMIAWCFEHLGEECSPIHGRVGRWHRGNAIIHGWAWFGFADEADMVAFLAAWPTPEGIANPDHIAREALAG